MFRIPAVLALALTLTFQSAAWAQATDQGADEIMTALTDWANSITGEKFTRAQIAAEISIRPQEDHYVASLPLSAGPDAPNLAADITQVLGRWVIDDILLPDSAAFKNRTGGPRLELEVDAQSSAVVLDDTFATATLGNAAMTGLGLHFHSDDGKRGTLVTADRVMQSAIVRPLFDSHADVALDTSAEALALQVEQVGTPLVRVGFGALRTSLAFDGTTRAGTAKLLQAMASKGNAARSAAATLPPGSAADAFAGFTSAMTIGSAFDGLNWDDGEIAGSARSGQVIFEAAQRDGLVNGTLRLDADMLALTGAKLAAFADLIPTRFSVRQTFANLPVAALVHLNALSDAGTAPALEDFQQLFARGGIQIDLSQFVVEGGGATVTATGKLVLTAPGDGVVTGTITAIGLDALQQHLIANPVLAKGVPLLIFLKGAGRTVDDQVIWDIAYRDRQLTVNGQNLSAILQSFPGARP